MGLTNRREPGAAPGGGGGEADGVRDGGTGAAGGGAAAAGGGAEAASAGFEGAAAPNVYQNKLYAYFSIFCK